MRISQASYQSQQAIFKQEKENIRALAITEAFKLKCEIEEKNLDILTYLDKLAAKDQELSKFRIINKRLLHRLEIIRNHYETEKKQIVYLKEENRVLKGKLLNTETEFIVNHHGVIEAQHKRMRIKKKSKETLSKIVLNDPIVTIGNQIDYDQKENLDHDIAQYENELKELFLMNDFRDFGIDAPVLLMETKEAQTVFEDFCGDCQGEAKDVVDQTGVLIDLIEMHLQALFNFQDNNKEFVRKASSKLDQLEFVCKPKNIQKIRNL